MAVYGVSPYAMPSEVALGCMVNMRMAQALRAMPHILAIASAFGNKAASVEISNAFADIMYGNHAQAATLINSLKTKGPHP